MDTLIKNIRLAFLLVLVLIGLPLCSEDRAGDEWDTYDKSLFVAHQIIRTVDMFQTQDIYNQKEFYEMNPVIDTGVDRFGTHFIPIYFVGMAVAEYFIADALPSNYRKAFLTVGSAVSVGLVYHNKAAGLNMSFKF